MVAQAVGGASTASSPHRERRVDRGDQRSSIQLVFWFTLVFALIERSTATKARRDRLDAGPAAGAAGGRATERSPSSRCRSRRWCSPACSSSGSRSRQPIVIGGQSRTRSSILPCGRSGCRGSWWSSRSSWCSRRHLRGRVAGPGLGVVNAVLAAASAVPAIWLLQTVSCSTRRPSTALDAAGVRTGGRTDLDRDHRGLVSRSSRAGTSSTDSAGRTSASAAGALCQA